MIPGLKAGPGFYAGGGPPTEWTLVAQSTFKVAAGSGSQTITIPGSPLEDDIVIVCMASDVIISRAADGGGVEVAWTDEIWNSDGPGAGHNPAALIVSKRMGSTPDTSFDCFRQTTRVQAGLIQIWRGAHTTTLLDMALLYAFNTINYPNAPANTTVTDDALRVIVGFLDDDDDAANATPPSGYTDFLAMDTEQSSTIAGATVMIASKVEPTAGVATPDTFTGSANDNNYCVHIAFRPSW